MKLDYLNWPIFKFADSFFYLLKSDTKTPSDIGSVLGHFFNAKPCYLELCLTLTFCLHWAYRTARSEYLESSQVCSNHVSFIGNDHA